MSVTEYTVVRNNPQTLCLPLVNKLFETRSDDEVYQKCVFEDMQQAAETNSGADFIIQRCNGRQDTYTEADLLNTIRACQEHNKRLEKKKGRKEALSHVHNLHKKALPYMFREFHKSVLEQLPVNRRERVSQCRNFAEFNDALNKLGYKQPAYNDVVDATDNFCKKYGVTPFFWKQAVSVSELNCTRNSEQHPSVRDSATAVGAALEKLEELTELKPAALMLDALAAFSLENAVKIDQEAEKERKSDEELLAALRKTQQARKQATGRVEAVV